MQITPDYLGGAHGIQNILNSYYEQQIASIGTIEEQLSARKLIEEGLIVDGARVSLAAAIVKNNFGIEDKLLEKLLHTRLIRVENTHLGRAYEVSHDTLVRPILKSYETRRLEEERLEQKRLLAYEQKKRRRFRLLAILGTVLCIAALVVLYIVWRQSKALQAQKQHLELSMGVAEASVFFSENNYMGAFGKAYQAYKKYQKLVAIDEEELKLDIIKNENLKDLKQKEPYIYRNIWSSFYASDKLYIIDDKVYSMPMPLVLDKAWLNLLTDGGSVLAGIKEDGNLELFNVESKETDSLSIPDPMEWLMLIVEKFTVISKNANKILYLDTTNTPILFDRSSRKMLTLNLDVEWDNIEEKVFKSLMQEDGERVVMFDDFLGGIVIFNSKGELTHDFQRYKFLALDNDQLYYRKEGFDQIEVLDLKTEALYFISLPRYAEELFVLDNYLAAQLEGGAIARVAKERSKTGVLSGFAFVDILEGDVEVLDVFEKNTLVVETIDEKGLPKVFLWEMESGDKQTLGRSYTDLLRVDSLMVYLDQGMIKIYQPSGLEIELVLPSEFEYTQMYLLKNRFLCLPNIYQDKTLVLDFKMSPVLVEGPWGDQVISSTPSKDGKQLLVVTP
ncbi:MAG: hypothetical protein GY810_23115 [Aureispira sp.]|nr:hypothetical protein [Aureispira sp.]